MSGLACGFIEKGGQIKTSRGAANFRKNLPKFQKVDVYGGETNSNILLDVGFLHNEIYLSNSYQNSLAAGFFAFEYR